jgi:hypothetical protein
MVFSLFRGRCRRGFLDQYVALLKPQTLQHGHAGIANARKNTILAVEACANRWIPLAAKLLYSPFTIES